MNILVNVSKLSIDESYFVFSYSFIVIIILYESKERFVDNGVVMGFGCKNQFKM